MSREYTEFPLKIEIIISNKFIKKTATLVCYETIYKLQLRKNPLIEK
jgi:hypothetical protein